MKTKLTIFILFFISFTLFSQNISLDKSFGDNGIFEKRYKDNTEIAAFDVKLTEDNSYLVALVVFDSEEEYYLLAKYDNTGQLDTTFADNGYYKCKLDVEFILKYMVLPSGYIVLTDMDEDDNFIISILDENGNFTFSYTVDFGNYNVSVYSILYRDDNLYAAGTYHKIEPGQSETKDSAFILKLTDYGTLDTTFGDKGVYKYGISGFQAETNEIVLQGKNIISAISYYGDNDEYLYTLNRIDLNGNLDEDFGDSGVAIIDDFEPEFIQLHIDSSDNIYLSTIEFAMVIKLTKEGELDESYGENGIAFSDSLNDLDPLTYFSFMNKGEVYFFGSKGFDESLQGAVPIIIKYNTQGKLDTLFGKRGIYSHKLDGESAEYLNGIIDNNGKFLVVGGSIEDSEAAYHELPNKIFMARYKFNAASIEDNVLDDMKSELYPNPVSNNRFTLTFDSKSSSKITIELMDINGKNCKLMYRGSANKGSNKFKLLLPENIKKGLYLVKINTEKGYFIRKLEIL